MHFDESVCGAGHDDLYDQDVANERLALRVWAVTASWGAN